MRGFLITIVVVALGSFFFLSNSNNNSDHKTESNESNADSQFYEKSASNEDGSSDVLGDTDNNTERKPSNDANSIEADSGRSDSEYKDDNSSLFHGYPCTEDCSGHEAGYEWASDNGITDPSDCGGNSNSFIEGCESYAEEYQNEPDSDFSDDDSYNDYDY